MFALKCRFLLFFPSLIILVRLGLSAAADDKRLQSYINIEILENEFVLASAEYLLSLADVKWTNTGNSTIYYVNITFTLRISYWLNNKAIQIYKKKTLWYRTSHPSISIGLSDIHVLLM